MTTDDRPGSAGMGDGRTLRNHLDFVQAKSPFYRQRVAPGSPLGNFPLMTRQLMRAHYPEILTDPAMRGGELLRVLQEGDSRDGRRHAGELALPGGMIVEQTSGTSGVPARFVKTREERCALAMAIWRRRKKFDPLITLRNFVPLFHLPPGARLPVDPFEPSDAGVRSFYEWLDAAGGRWLHLPPVLLDRHARALQRLGWKNPAPRLKYIETSGAPLRPEVMQATRAALDVTLVNQYGIREVWAIGYSSGNEGFGILDEAVAVELIDEGGAVIDAGGVTGSVIVTSKILQLLPLVRYVTGDRGCWRDTPGGRVLELGGDRDATMLFFRGRWVSGTELFKTALANVYHRIGYRRIDHIQVRKTGEKAFVVDIAGEDSDAVFRALVEDCRTFDPEAEFVQNRIADLGALKRNPNLKPYIFINQFDKMERIAGPGP